MLGVGQRNGGALHRYHAECLRHRECRGLSRLLHAVVIFLPHNNELMATRYVMIAP